MLDVEPEE
jgi:hypothetical protein